MIRVSNRARVRRLGRQAMGAAKTRNLIAIVAIALTTVLFTSLFTIALSINDGFQQSNFRQAGGYAHGSFKNVTLDQVDVLKEDPLVEAYGLRRMLGMATGDPFQKTHVEVAYADANYAQWSYATPTTGALPQEGTDQAAADTQVLDLLGVTPEIGAQFTLTLDVDGQETTQTFTLSGWWEHDAAIPAGFVQVPNSRVEAVLQEAGVTPPGSDGITGAWSMDVMLPNSLHIDGDMGEILARCGFQSDDPSGENYINYGVNWGYTGAQLLEDMDPATLVLIGVVLVLILLTGYLIIYNVFQISVANDVRFYGLLKTIGTTGRQIKAMLRQQALLLSCVGIPIGLAVGWLVGGRLTPAVVAQLDGVSDVVSVSPVIFLGSAGFALLTVFLSCARPGRMAAKVSPVEAVRYTEGSGSRKKTRRPRKAFSLAGMAWANLGRSRGKTVVTVLSLTLAVVLLNFTVTVARGFDMDKYVSRQLCTDFTLADAGHFQTGEIFNPDQALPQAANYRLCDYLLLAPGCRWQTLGDYEALVLAQQCGRTAASVQSCGFDCEALSAESEESEKVLASLLDTAKEAAEISPHLYEKNLSQGLLLPRIILENGEAALREDSFFLTQSGGAEWDSERTELYRLLTGQGGVRRFWPDGHPLELRRCTISVTCHGAGEFTLRLDCHTAAGQTPDSRYTQWLAEACTRAVKELWAEGVDVLSLGSYQALREGESTYLAPTKNACPQLRTDVRFTTVL